MERLEAFPIVRGGQNCCQWDDNVDAREMLRFGEQTNIPMRYPYEDRLFLVGFALLIKRLAIERTGLLDERFFPGNNEDVDLGLRIIKAGYRNVLCKNSFILHFGSKTFEKDMEGFKATAKRNRKKINEKWGFDIDYQLHPKTMLIDLIEVSMENPICILDVGCGCGASMGYIRGRYPNAKTYGIERDPEMAEIASRMGEVLCGDVEKIKLPWGPEYFDYILLGDMLEHLKEPEETLKKLRIYLKPDGHIILDALNVKHYSVIIPLLEQDVFSYSDMGILQKTHTRMYTGEELKNIVMRSGYEMEKLNGIIMERPENQKAQLIKDIACVMGGIENERFLIYRYCLRAKK